MARKKSYNTYNKSKSKPRTGYEKYTPSTVGKIAVGIVTPSLIIAVIALIVTLFTTSAHAFAVTMITVAIAFVGSIVIMIDIIVFNHKQKKATSKPKEPKEPDIVRAIYMIIGIVVGVIIGYLIWG